MDKRTMPRLVCICGPDGTGKTTQARLLVDDLSSIGMKAKYIWLRFSHIISLPLLGYMRFVGISKMERHQGGDRIGHHDLWGRPLLSRIYGICLFLDMYLATLARIRTSLALGYVVVCDRYVVDTIVDIATNTRRSGYHKTTIGNLILRIAPRDTKYLVMISASSILRSRRKDVGLDSMLDDRIREYQAIASDMDIPLIDVGNMSIDAVRKRLQLEIEGWEK